MCLREHRRRYRPRAEGPFRRSEARGRGGSNPSKNGATVQHPPDKPHGDAENTVAGADATPDNSATPPDPSEYPHLRVVGGSEAQDCTLDAYAEYTGLSVDFLKGLGLKEIHYIDQKAVKMPYFDATGSEEICVRFRVSLAGTPKVKTRKGDKHKLYGLWRIEEARKAGYAILVEGESDAHVGWHHGLSVIGVPGATGFPSDWVAELDGVEKIYAVVEPDEGGKHSGSVSPPQISGRGSTGSTSTASRICVISTSRLPQGSSRGCAMPVGGADIGLTSPRARPTNVRGKHGRAVRTLPALKTSWSASTRR